MYESQKSQVNCRKGQDMTIALDDKTTSSKSSSLPVDDFDAANSASVIDLFCGAGGLSFGFKQVGFPIVAGMDIDESCRFSYEANNDAPFLACDVSALTAADLNKYFLPNKRKILIGCAPCQPFSTYNHKNSDPKWNLVGKFGELISKTLPDIVSMENVPRLADFKNGDVFNDFVKILENKEYKVDAGILYGPDFGLAQTRSRLVLVASRLGPIKLPNPTHLENHVTVEQIIGNLPKLDAGQSDPNDPLHKSASLSDLNLKRIKASKQGGSWQDWPQEIVAKCHQSETGKTYSGVYGRMSWKKPSPTITTQFFGFGNGRFGHPSQNRALSLREGAMLQGFPHDYKFVKPGDPVYMGKIGKLIGNAVPVTLSRAIAQSIKDHLSEYK